MLCRARVSLGRLPSHQPGGPHGTTPEHRSAAGWDPRAGHRGQGARRGRGGGGERVARRRRSRSRSRIRRGLHAGPAQADPRPPKGACAVNRRTRQTDARPAGDLDRTPPGSLLPRDDHGRRGIRQLEPPMQLRPPGVGARRRPTQGRARRARGDGSEGVRRAPVGGDRLGSRRGEQRLQARPRGDRREPSGASSLPPSSPTSSWSPGR